MLKKNVSVILIILLALLLIALVVWLYDKRIDNIDKQMKPALVFKIPRKSALI